MAKGMRRRPRSETHENGPGGLKDRVHQYLTRLKHAGAPLWFLKVHGGPFQRAGVPDFLICARGRFLAIELKVGAGAPTPAQRAELEAISAADGASYVARTVEEVREIVESVLNATEPM